MTTEMLINVAPREVRAALLEQGVLQDLYIERASCRGIVGNVYKGCVQRVLPGMQAAFVEIGLERTAFLHVGDISGVTRPEDTMIGFPRVDDIRRLVSQGEEILVQVVKDPLGSKGARLSTFVALPSRYLVYMPRGESVVGVSARIEEEAERQRLRETVQRLAGERQTGGYIARTAAAGVPPEALQEDMTYLGRLWDHVRDRAARTPAGRLVHEDLPLSLRLLRDELGRGIERVLVDSPGSSPA